MKIMLMKKLQIMKSKRMMHKYKKFEYKNYKLYFFTPFNIPNVKLFIKITLHLILYNNNYYMEYYLTVILLVSCHSF